jgi:1-acyl-sn-glycerol-3-phosphate acyltransferase
MERAGEILDALAVPGRVGRRVAALGSAWWRVRGLGRVTDPGAAALAFHAAAARLSRDNGIVIERRGAQPPAGCVVVANHVSYVDTMVLPALLPCTCIAKSEVARWPAIGGMTARLGVLFVERGSAASGARVLRQAMRALRAGVTVVAFPEGTTSPGIELLPFRRGVFGIARMLGVPVVGATLAYEDPEIAWIGETPFVGHYLGRVARQRHTRVRVSFSEPFQPQQHPSAAALAAAVRECIAADLPRRRMIAGSPYAAPSGRTTSLPTPSS